MQRSQLRPVLIGVALVLVVGLVCLLQTSAGDRILRSMGLQSPPAEFTELWFGDRTTQGEVPANGRVQVQFMVRSHGDATSQPWRVRLGPTPATVPDSGAVAVADGQTSTVRTRVRVDCAGTDPQSRFSLTVELPDAGVDIVRWFSCGTRATAGSSP